METKKEIYLEDEFLKVELEDVWDVLFVHVTFKTFSPTIYKYAKLVWEELKLDAYMSGYDRIFSYSKNKKFVNKFEPDFLMVGENYKGLSLFVIELEDNYGY